jgi:hypothetical protein
MAAVVDMVATAVMVGRAELVVQVLLEIQEMRGLVVQAVLAELAGAAAVEDQMLVHLAEQAEQLVEMLVAQVTITVATILLIKTAELAVLLEIVQVDMAAGAVMQVIIPLSVIFKVAAAVVAVRVVQHQIAGLAKQELLEQ